MDQNSTIATTLGQQDGPHPGESAGLLLGGSLESLLQRQEPAPTQDTSWEITCPLPNGFSRRAVFLWFPCQATLS